VNGRRGWNVRCRRRWRPAFRVRWRSPGHSREWHRRQVRPDPQEGLASRHYKRMFVY